MDPITIVTLLGVIGTVIGTIITNSSNRSNVENTNETNQQIAQETNQAQSLLAQQQHAWNVEDWKMQAAYDSPQAQMQRFRDAGLNPGLIYGQMSQGPTINSTEQPNLQMAHMQPFLAQNPMENIDPLSLARLRNIEANTEYVEAQTETENTMRQARYDNLSAATENLNKQNEEVVARIKRMAKENELTDSQLESLKLDRWLAKHNYWNDKKRLRNETRMTDAQIEKLDADRRKALAEAKVTEREFDEMIWTYTARYLNLTKQLQVSDAQIAQANVTARKLGLDADMITGKASFENYWLDRTNNGNAVQGVIGLARYAFQAAMRDFGGIIH